MARPTLAAVEDLAARMSTGIDDDDVARAQALLEDASALVRAAAKQTWITAGGALDETVPDVAVTITIAAAKRALEIPQAVTSETTGPFSQQFANRDGDLVYLTDAERQTLEGLRGTAGLWALRTTRGDACLDTYLDVDPPGEKIPFLAAEPW